MITLVVGVLLMVLLDYPLWGAAISAILITTFVAVPDVLRRRNQRRWAWTWLIVVPVVGLPLSRIDGRDACLQCGTSRRYSALGWGVGGDWVRIPLSRDERPSHAQEDFFANGHVHAWNGAWRHTRGAFHFNGLISGGCKASGSGYLNRFGSRYDESGAFRELVKERIRAGDVTADQVRLLLGLSMNFHRHASVPPGTHALVKRAGEWMGEDFWDPALETDWPPERPDAR